MLLSINHFYPFNVNLVNELYREFFMKKEAKYFLIGLAIFIPICVLTVEWRILQILILLLFLVYGIGFFFLKEFKKYIPLSAAFFVALCYSIFIYPLIQTAI
jgi:hypothetical protein